jgi:hypothetical protein
VRTMAAMGPSVLAWSLFAAFVAIVLATLALVAFGSATGDELTILLLVGFAVVGTLIATRRPNNAVGWLLMAIAISLGFSTLTDSYVRDPSAPLLAPLAWISTWIWHVWLAGAAILLPLLFPNGRLVSPRWRPVVLVGVLALVLSIFGAALRPGPLDTESPVPIENPLGVGATGVMDALATAGDVLLGLGSLLAAASLVVRVRRSRGAKRQQLKWFAYVGVIAIAGLMLAMMQVLLGVEPGERAEAGWLEAIGAGGWFIAFGALTIGLPVATGVAILRHRLYDIDVVINRTLVYGLLTATLAGAYLGSVLLQLALGPVTSGSSLAVAVSTLGVAALFRPARARIQALVDRRFYRSKYDAARTLEDFSAAPARAGRPRRPRHRAARRRGRDDAACPRVALAEMRRG